MTVESMDTDAVGEFLTDGALLRGELHEKLHSLKVLQTRVSAACVFVSGDVDGPTITNETLETMKALELFADNVRGDVTGVEQQEQFETAGVTVVDDGDFTIMTGDDDDEVEVHELADGRLAVYVNGNEIELTEEQSAALKIETGKGDDEVSIGINVASSISVDGGSGDDSIVGGSGDDDLSGGSGDDSVRGRAGDDRVAGGTGSDELSGGSGDDRLVGGSGDDELSGGSGDDRVFGEEGNDEVSGGSGDDALYGGDGDDTIDGGSGDDDLSGGDGDDTIDGGDGSDELRGNDGDDMITGDSTEDTFHGNDNDTIVDTKPEPIEEAPRRPRLFDTGWAPVDGFVDDALGESKERLGEYGEYLGEANARRFERDPSWMSTPGGWVDAVFEDGSAAVGIIGMDGKLYHGDPDGYCGNNHSCITGVSTPLGGAITLGHTVLYTEKEPRPDIIAHEQQHVFQYEEHGTLGFGTRWVASSVVDFALGGDGYYDTEHEREGYFVQDHYAEGARADPDLVVPDDYYPTTEEGSGRSYQRGSNKGGTFDDRGIAGEISAIINEAIWR